MPRRRSLFWPSLFAAAALLVLLALGGWQVERLWWKSQLIAERQAAVTAPVSALPRRLEDARRLDYHPVRATGRFANERELYLGATDDDGHMGYHVITPLALADGAVVLVDRGFVPEARRAAASRAAGEVSGEVTVTGLMRLAAVGKPHWFLPDNSAAHNYWFYVDIPAMAAAAQVEGVLPFYIDADNTPNPGNLPLGGQTRIDLPNNHLQYALTWFALAAALVVIYVLFISRRRAEGDAA